MRQALRQVREQLGPDAVILSSRRVLNGVEVTAAIDHEVAEQVEEATAIATPAQFDSEEFVRLSPTALAKAGSPTPGAASRPESRAVATAAALPAPAQAGTPALSPG